MELGWGLSKLLVLPLYLTWILAIILTLAYRIEIGIFLVIPFIPHQNVLHYIHSLPLGKELNDLLLVAVIIKWVINKRKANESVFIKTPLNIPLVVLMLWTYIGVWWGTIYFGDPLPLTLKDFRFAYWIFLMRIPLMYFIIVNNIKNPDHKKLIIFLIIMAILLLDRNFYNIAMYKDLSYYDDNQKVGGMAALGGNELSVFFAMYTIVLVALLSYARNFWLKCLLFIPIGASYYCTAFLFSRSGYLASVVGLIAVGFLKNKNILIALVVVGLFWQVLLPNAVKQRIEMTKTEDGLDETSLQRFAMWEIGQEIIFSSPILGAGIQAAQALDITPEGFKGRVWHSFHNGYVQQAVETGFIGLGIYLWIFSLMILIGWRLYRAGIDDWLQQGLGLGLIACVLACLAGNIAGGYWNYFSVVGYMYVIAGLVMQSLIDIEQEKDVSLSVQDNINETNIKKNSTAFRSIQTEQSVQ